MEVGRSLYKSTEDEPPFACAHTRAHTELQECSRFQQAEGPQNGDIIPKPMGPITN